MRLTLLSRSLSLWRTLTNAKAGAVSLVMLAFAGPLAVCAEPLRLVAAQRGNWETAVPELGKDQGIFRKHGVDLDIIYSQGTGETIQLVVSGQVDVGISLGTLSVMGAYQKGAPIRVIAASSTGFEETFFYVPATSPVRSMKDTNGKTVAFATVGSSTQIAALSLISLAGSTAKGVATGDVPATLTQVMSGQVDVGWATAPFLLDQINRGEVRMIARASDVPRLRRMTMRVQVANAKSYGEKPELMKRYLAAYRETLDWMYSSPEAKLRYMAFSGLSETAVNSMMKEFISRDSLQTEMLHGLAENIEDARSFKFLQAPLTQDQVVELFRIPVKEN